MGLGLPGTPILLAESSCGFTILGLWFMAAEAVACVDAGRCLRSLVKALENLWSIPGVFRMEGDSA